MSSLAGLKWYVAVLALALGAIAAQLVAKHHAGRGMIAMARATAVPGERLHLQQAASWHAQRSDLWGVISFGFAVLAVGSWLVFRMRREPGPQGVLLVPIAVILLFSSTFY